MAAWTPGVIDGLLLASEVFMDVSPSTTGVCKPVEGLA